MRIVTGTSHTDHNLSAAHLSFLETHFKGRNKFFIETVEIPQTMQAVQCGLYGPDMGDGPIAEEHVTYGIRGNRTCATRFIKNGEMRFTRKITVVAGPAKIGDEEYACVLYTAYGGPEAPREPGDPGLNSMEDIKKSRDYWSKHALVKG